MNIDFRTKPRNSARDGWSTVPSETVFNFDGLPEGHTQKQLDFLRSLGQDWKVVPEDLLDPTTRQNFTCFARLPV